MKMFLIALKSDDTVKHRSFEYVESMLLRTMAIADGKLLWCRLRILLFVLLIIVLVAGHGAAANKCLLERPEVSPKRNFYHSGKNLPIRIEASDRPSHQLVSRILRILLLDVLGYSKVEVVRGSTSIAPTLTLNRLLRTQYDGSPSTMVNLEVWLPAGFSIEPWLSTHHVINAGPLGPTGRFGWFMTSSIVSDRWNSTQSILDHWKALRLPDVAGLFSLADQEEELRRYVRPQGKLTGPTFCDNISDDCDNGIYRSPRCRGGQDSRCALLLTSFPELYGSDLIEWIHSLDLRVNIAWIGDHLESFVHDRVDRNLPILFFSWVPNTLTSSDKLTRVHLPSCDDGILGGSAVATSTAGCDFSIHQLTKMMWTRLHTHTPEAHHLIQNFHFSTAELELLLSAYKQTIGDPATTAAGKLATDGALERAACEWVRGHEPRWTVWMPNVSTSKQTIYLGGLFPVKGPYWRQPGIVPGAHMAVQYINSDDSILGDYRLELLVEDSMCKVDVAMKHFLHYAVDKTYPVAGILGPGCSETAEPIAGVSKHFNMVVISYSAESLNLANRAMYPLFFRTIPHILQNGEVYVELFRRWKWEQAGLLAEDAEKFPEFNSFIKDLFLSRSLQVAYDRKIPRGATIEDASKYLDDLKKKDVKIVILTAYEQSGRKILCEAYRKDMTAKFGYVWFLPAWFTEHWWDTDMYNAQFSEEVPCTSAEMSSAVQGHFLLKTEFLAAEDAHIVGNCTVRDWLETYLSHLSELHFEFSPYASYAYDAVFVFALGLHKLLTEDPSALESLHTDKTVQQFMFYLNNTHFSGASGPVQFTGADRTGIISIFQHIGNNSGLVGQFSPQSHVNSSERLTLNESQIRWMTSDGKRPNDGTPTPKQCNIEGFRALLGVECDTAIAIANISGILGFIIITIIVVIIIKQSYDMKMRRFTEKNGYLAAQSWPALDKWELARDRVVLNRKLGEGAFGTVYGGEALIEDTWVAVAVKTLKMGSNTEEKLDFLSEAEMMKRFDHKNIVKLLGVCTRGEPVYAVMEFMLHGDLKTFLLSRRHLVGQSTKEAEDINVQGLTKMALDVAQGLKYLSDLKYVHRDLACRNCLVHAGKAVKIGDFGMTRPMYDTDYYRFNKRGMFPVRWMAPESLSDGIFRTSSDVWSFGVLLYEIMTFGSYPYQGLSNRQVLAYVKSGQHIILPAACPVKLAELVLSCWLFEPKSRPTIEQIVELLEHNPTLIRPCLDSPSAALALEGTASLEMSLAPRPRAVRGVNPRRSSGDVWTHRRGLSVSTSHDEDSKLSGGEYSPDATAMVSLMDPIGGIRGGSVSSPPMTAVVPRYCKTTATPHGRVSFDSLIRMSVFGRSISTEERRPGTGALVVSLGRDADNRRLDNNFVLGVKSAPSFPSTAVGSIDEGTALDPSRRSPVINDICRNNDDCPAPTSSLESRTDSDYCSQHSKDFTGCNNRNSAHYV